MSIGQVITSWLAGGTSAAFHSRNVLHRTLNNHGPFSVGLLRQRRETLLQDGDPELAHDPTVRVSECERNTRW